MNQLPRLFGVSGQTPKTSDVQHFVVKAKSKQEAICVVRNKAKLVRLIGVQFHNWIKSGVVTSDQLKQVQNEGDMVKI